MKLTLKELAGLVGGELKGPPDRAIEGAAGLDAAGPSDVSYLASIKYAPLLETTRAGCVLLAVGFQVKSERGIPVVYTADPHWAFVQVLRILEKERRPKFPPGVHASAVVHPTARLGQGVSVGAGCVIEENARIGDFSVLMPQCYVGRGAALGQNCFLNPRVVVGADCEIGNRVILQPGVVIGGDGYGYLLKDGRHEKIPQLGRVIIEDGVEIGANSAIDRATTGETRIGSGTKIDNLVQIAHNVKIGRHCLIVSQAGIAGSSQVGDHAILAGQAGVPDHVRIGNKAILMAQSGVIADVPDGAVMFGTPARPHREAMKLQALLGKLPEIYQAVKKQGAKEPTAAAGK